MYVEFVGLPGSGKSSVLSALIKKSAKSTVPCRSLKEVANKTYAELSQLPGYLKRKPGHGWFFGMLTFAHQYPEAFRTLFENSISDSWVNLNVMELLGQYYFAQSADLGHQPILCDEGFLHRGAVSFLQPNCYSDLDTYLKHIPRCDVVIHIDLDVETSLARCKSRPKGLPRTYRPLSEAEVIEQMDQLQKLHQLCLHQQEEAGVRVIRVDGQRPLEELRVELYEALLR